MLSPSSLSSVLLAVPVLCFLYQFFRGDRKKALTLLSAYLFLSAVVILAKFVLKVPRPEGAQTSFDPYAFPSYHTAYASLLFFIFPNPFTFLYALLMGYLRVAAGVHSWPDVIGGFIFAGVSWWLYGKGKELVGFEWDRQAFHMGTGALLGLLLYKSWQWGVALLIIALLLGLLFHRWRKHPWVAAFLDFFDRDGTGRGAFTFIVGSVAAVVINPSLGWVAVWYLAYVDAVATLAGKCIGTKRKSIYGAAAGLLAGILVAIATDTPLWFAPVVSAVEFLSPVDDNVTIPVAVAAMGWLA
ncbi:TPA: hypothetical protein EYP13_02100 [Candidatus Micrarchaeota archaeon]|nr:hypothetical protein [Candidatus Micrarchaeota archaeon]